jgi:hypothetical protein
MINCILIPQMPTAAGADLYLPFNRNPSEALLTYLKVFNGP